MKHFLSTAKSYQYSVISKKWEIGCNRKLDTDFRLISKVVTLNDLDRVMREAPGNYVQLTDARPTVSAMKM